jgi:hypothetical protein
MIEQNRAQPMPEQISPGTIESGRAKQAASSAFDFEGFADNISVIPCESLNRKGILWPHAMTI